MQLKVRRIHPKSIIPRYAQTGDAGLDLYSIQYDIIKPTQRLLIPTGLAIELPPNTEAQIRPRSGLALKHGISVLNSPGTIDSGYRGEVGVILINHGAEDFVITPGMKIAQMVITPYFTVKTVEAELSDSQRCQGGFGSTGY
jgi:dUTP pyrophosphatase